MPLYSADIRDEVLDVLVIEDLEVDIETSIQYGEVRIDDITMEGRSLYRGSPMTSAIAHLIAEQALNDSAFLEAAFEEHGVGDHNGEHRHGADELGIKRVA